MSSSDSNSESSFNSEEYDTKILRSKWKMTKASTGRDRSTDGMALIHLCRRTVCVRGMAEEIGKGG